MGRPARIRSAPALYTPLVLPTIIKEFVHAKPRHRHDHAGSGIHFGAERIHHLRGWRAFLDVERYPVDHAHATGRRRRILWRAEASGRRRNVIHDGIPRHRRRGGDTVFDHWVPAPLLPRVVPRARAHIKTI